MVSIPTDCSVKNKAVGSNDREGSNLDGAQQTSAADCPESAKSIQQLGLNFGCIPLTPILLYRGNQKVWYDIPEMLQD